MAFGVLHLPLLIAYGFGDSFEHRGIFLTAVLLQHLVLFALFTFRPDGKKTDLSVMLFTSFAFLAAWSYGLFASDTPVHAVLLAALSLVYSACALWFFLRKRSMEVYLAIATFGWFLWLNHVLEASSLSASLVVEGAIALSLGIVLKSRMQQLTGIAAYLIGAAQVVADPVTTVISGQTVAWLALLGSMVALYTIIGRTATVPAYQSGRSYLLWVDAALFLYFITQITNAFTVSLDYQIRLMILSAVWLVYAISIIIVGVLSKYRNVRLAGILLLLITLLKVIFVDLPDVSAAVRAILFLGLGSIGVAVSRLFYKRKE
jgi:uncharacterized membrane protein